MKPTPQPLLVLILATLLMATSPLTQADDHESYGSIVGRKALNGFTNMTTSVLEIPKNVINTTNQSNIFYGFTGGIAKGILNAVGRTMVGLNDFILAPLPTKQVVHPAYVWTDFFETDTTYSEIYKIQK